MMRQLPWMRNVQVGTVLRSRSGLMRIVREVSRGKAGDLKYVTCVIKRCSWTKRCYTLLSATDLRINGYQPVAVVRRATLTKLDKQIAREISGKDNRKITCCDVVGIP